MAGEAPAAKRCQSCGSGQLNSFYRTAAIPTQSTVLLDSAEAAKGFPTGDLELALCELCGLIQNVLYQPGLVDYTLPTEESQIFSPLFAEYAATLADRLVHEHDLIGRTVLEVGSGKGEFLALLADRGIGKGVGVDPGFQPERAPGDLPRLEFRREFYGPDTNLTGDLVVARHLLEHLPNVGEFLKLMRRSAAATPGSVFLLEVPDTWRILSEAAFWDVYYEHCSYFTRESVRSSLLFAGLHPTKIELVFGDQYILAWSSPTEARSREASPSPEQMEVLITAAQVFGEAALAAAERWRVRFEDELDRGREVVVWGASSKAVAFLSSVGVTDVTVVDINPHKQGKWLPGIPLEVLPPADLRHKTPGLVIPMNPIYEGEIRADLMRMGHEPAMASLG